MNCWTCHQTHPYVSQSGLAPTHSGLSGYDTTSAACFACHPAGVGEAPADHDLHFPVSAGTKHAGVGCRECHTNLAAPTVVTNFDCGTCHLGIESDIIAEHTTTTSNTRITVKSSEISLTNSRTCLRCHADGQVDWTSAHPNRSPCAEQGAPPHRGAGCTQCHSSYRTDKTYAASFTANPPPGCAQCHENRLTCN
jgi:hypothetical protein